jgi:addiction module HigA family antidote
MALNALHPGEHLAEELKKLNMSAAALARRLKVPTNRITGILNGERAITGDTALRLAHSLARPLSSGLTCRAATSCASHSRKQASPSKRSRLSRATNSFTHDLAHRGLSLAKIECGLVLQIGLNERFFRVGRSLLGAQHAHLNPVLAVPTVALRYVRSQLIVFFSGQV